MAKQNTSRIRSCSTEAVPVAWPSEKQPQSNACPLSRLMDMAIIKARSMALIRQGNGQQVYGYTRKEIVAVYDFCEFCRFNNFVNACNDEDHAQEPAYNQFERAVL